MAILKPLARLLAAALVAALAAAPLGLASPARAQPQLVESDPPDGAVLKAAPSLISLCFSQPVINDVNLFDFAYILPDGRRLGLRIEFGLENRCMDIFVGLSDVYPAGQYTLEWLVTAEEGREQGSGTLRFQVTEATAPTPEPSPAPPPSPTPLPAETPTPVATETPSGGPAREDGGGGPDILLMALLTIAVAGGAAVVATLGYVLRRAIGFDPHRPPEDEEGGGGGH
jgi:methionine-rich copper-binding protein CopC